MKTRLNESPDRLGHFVDSWRILVRSQPAICADLFAGRAALLYGGAPSARRGRRRSDRAMAIARRNHRVADWRLQCCRHVNDPVTGLKTCPGFTGRRPTRSEWRMASVTFSLLVTNQASVSYQWQLNATNLARGQRSGDQFDQLEPEFERREFQLSRFQRVRLRHERAGHVDGDPGHESAGGGARFSTSARTNVQIVYSKLVAAASATNTANYVFIGGSAGDQRGAERGRGDGGVDDGGADLWEQLFAGDQRGAGPGDDTQPDCHEHDGDIFWRCRLRRRIWAVRR